MPRCARKATIQNVSFESFTGAGRVPSIVTEVFDACVCDFCSQYVDVVSLLCALDVPRCWRVLLHVM